VPPSEEIEHDPLAAAAGFPRKELDEVVDDRAVDRAHDVSTALLHADEARIP
jgi:hypothetical protein